MKTFHERFSYVIPCLYSGLNDDKKPIYKVLPTISLLNTSEVFNLPLSKIFCDVSEVYNEGVVHLYEVIHFILLEVFSSNQYNFDSLTYDLLHMPFGFGNFEYRLFPRDSGKSFDIIITPVSYVDDNSLDND